MKIKIVAVGKIKEKYFNDAINEYIKRITPFASVEIIEIADESIPFSASVKEEEKVKEKETNKILSKIKQTDFVVCLTLREKEYDSVSFAKFLQDSLIRGCSCVTFIIGGSLGLHKLILDRANFKITLSEMTFTHQMTRIIILEQIYRSFKILNNEPYHK